MNLLELFVKVGVKDEASPQMESLSSGMIAKGQLIASTIEGAMRSAASSINGFLQNALSSFGNYEQQVGGMQTFFGDAAGTVITNAQNAYKTAGMSANQYMTNVSSFAMSLVNSVAKKRSKVAQQDTSVQKKELDTQVSNLENALSKQYSSQQKAFSKAYSARSQELGDELDALRESLEKQVSERQKAMDGEIKLFQKATDEHIKEINREYDERLKLVDEEEYERVKALQDQIDARDAQTEAENAAVKAREQEEKKADLRRQIADAKFIEDREKAEREYNNYIAELAQEQLEEERANQNKADREQIQTIRDSAAKRRSELKNQQAEEVEDYKNARSEELEALRESNNEKISKMREANQQAVKEQQRANAAILESMKESQDAQLEAMKASQDAQVQALKDSVAEQKAALKEAASDADGFVQATSEDQQRAAEIADIAMRDMSDNANKMGSSMESVQNAYQGFAKANFTMLDNLKLGYAGTKEGMQSLLDDAERVSAGYGDMRDFSIDSFADIVEAIHIMQVEMGVSGLTVDELKQKMADNDFTMQELSKLSEAWYGNRDSIEAVKQSIEGGEHVINDFSSLLGTTALEGSTTFEGSLNRVKAAWENWLVSLTDPEWDVAGTTQTLMDEVANAASIIIPRVATILATLATEVAARAPEIWEQFKTEMMNALPPEFQEQFQQVIEAITSIGDAVVQLATFISENIETIRNLAVAFAAFEVISTVVGFIANLITVFGPLVEAIGGAVAAAGGLQGVIAAIGAALTGPVGIVIAIGAAIAAIVAFVANNEEAQKFLLGIWNGIVDFFSHLPENIGNFLNSAWQTIQNIWGNVTSFMGDAIRGLADGVRDGIESILNWFRELPQNIINFFSGAGEWLVNAGKNILNGFWNGLTSVWNDLTGWIGDIGNWIQQHKGPESYDRQLLVKNGGWIMEGLQKGLEDQFEDEVVPYVNSMAGIMQNEFGTPVLSSVVGTMNRTAHGMNQSQQQQKQMTVILELDRVQFGRLVYQLNNDETQRVGVQLAGGYA